MSTILDEDKLDAFGFMDDGKTEVLFLFDHLDWEDGETHLKLLQDKLNTYLLFIQSGQKELPRHHKKLLKHAERIVIMICFEFEPSKDCVENLAMGQKKVEPLNIELNYLVMSPGIPLPRTIEELRKAVQRPGKAEELK